MWLDEKLAFLDGDDAATRLSKIRAFELVFVLILVTEYWARAIPKWGELSEGYYASLAVASVLCGLALLSRWRRLAFAGLALNHAVLIANEFPAAGNHAYLELFLCMLCAGLDVRKTAEQALFLRSVRWIVCVLFFFSGLQKLVHGYWLRGQYLAFSVWIESFRPVLQPLISADDYTRLLSYARQPGDGPYLVSSPLLLIVSNGIYLAEMAVSVLLAIARTRLVGILLAIALVVGIEVAARELFFGLVLINALLLFLPTDFNRRLVPAFGVVLGWLLLVRVGIAPEMTFY